MAVHNNVFISGRMARDPEIRYSNGEKQTAIARFTVATNREFKNAEGKYDADFISCVAYSKTAEFLEKFFHKGDAIDLNGRLQTGSYTDKNGNKVYTTDVIAENIAFNVGGGKSSNEGTNNAPQTIGSIIPPSPATQDKFLRIPDNVEDEGLPWN